MSSTYRKERYLLRTAEKKAKWYFILTIFCISIVIAFSVFIINVKKNEYKAAIEKQDLVIENYTNELDWLRAINPIKGDYLDLDNKLVNSSNLYPGWVTRVYPVPDSMDESIYLNDVGTFILNESKFSLASHRHHGITQQNKSMYVLNALLPSRVEGRHQIGIKLALNKNTSDRNETGLTKRASCYSQLFINHKRVIDKKIKLVGFKGTNDLHTGEVNLVRGLFPISAKIYCDKNSNFYDRDMEISILFRDPHQQNFQDSKFNVFHIYKPNTEFASL